MLQEEDDLARLVGHVVPTPPNVLSADHVEELAQQVYRTRPRPAVRRWAMPLLSAAAVCALISGTVVGVHSFVGSTRAPAASPNPSTPDVGSSSSSPSKPWLTTPLPGQLALTLVGTDTDLYTVYTNVGDGTGVTTIKRIDPASGTVTAVATISGITDQYAPGQGRPVIANGLLWIPSGLNATGAAILRGLALASLRTTSELTVQFSGVTTDNDVAALAAAPDGTLYLGGGNSYVSIDPANGSIGVRMMISGGQIGGLAVAPDNSRVYVGVTDNLFFTTYSSDTSFVQTRQPVTGAIIAQVGDTPADTKIGATLGGIQAMIASAGGVWVSNQPSPHGNSAQFIPTDLHPTDSGLAPGATGGGGALALATTTASTVWLSGGNHGMSCLDPSTGAARAATVPPERLSSVTIAGQRTFAIDAGSRGVVRLSPPQACAP